MTKQVNKTAAKTNNANNEANEPKLVHVTRGATALQKNMFQATGTPIKGLLCSDVTGGKEVANQCLLLGIGAGKGTMTSAKQYLNITGSNNARPGTGVDGVIKSACQKGKGGKYTAKLSDSYAEAQHYGQCIDGSHRTTRASKFYRKTVTACDRIIGNAEFTALLVAAINARTVVLNTGDRSNSVEPITSAKLVAHAKLVKSKVSKYTKAK